jgi:hypothetical protein
MKPRLMTVLIVAGIAVFLALTKIPHGTADEGDEGKPITSGAARVSRNAAGHVLITVAPATQKDIGLATETLKAVVRPIEVEAYGFVLGPRPLSKLNSDLISAQATLDASRQQYRRASRLYAEQKNVSLRELQTAQAAYLTDEARLGALKQQLRDTWGSEIARMPSRSRSDLVRALVDRREAIARVTVPIGEMLDGSPGKAEIIVLGHEEHPLNTRTVFGAPNVDPRMQGQTFLLLVGTSGFPVRSGAAVSAYLPASGKAEPGVMVPRSAVVRYAGKRWVYQELDRNRFARREVVPAQFFQDGYFVTQNLRTGMRIVITGAQALLSEELQAQIQPED